MNIEQNLLHFTHLTASGAEESEMLPLASVIRFRPLKNEEKDYVQKKTSGAFDNLTGTPQPGAPNALDYYYAKNPHRVIVHTDAKTVLEVAEGRHGQRTYCLSKSIEELAEMSPAVLSLARPSASSSRNTAPFPEPR